MKSITSIATLINSKISPMAIDVNNESINTTSTDYIEISTVKYTADTSGRIVILQIGIDIMPDNSGNGRCKLQISGDGGTTWYDLTGDLSGTSVDGYGRQISQINAGIDMLQIKALGKSSNGAIATAGFDSTSSFLDIYMTKYIF